MTTLIVPAAGKGSRLGGECPKALLDLGGRRLIDWVISAGYGLIDHLIVVIQPQERPFFEHWAAHAELPAEVTWALQDIPEGSLAAVRVGMECARNAGWLASGVVIVWADQVGVSASTLQAVSEHLATGEKVLAVPLAEASRPYVWVELDDAGRIARVMRTKDGDAPPATGLADLGVFGLSERLASAFLDAPVRSSGESAGRELDFTYALPSLSALSRTTFLPRIAAERELIAINTPADLAHARAVLGAGR